MMDIWPYLGLLRDVSDILSYLRDGQMLLCHFLLLQRISIMWGYYGMAVPSHWTHYNIRHKEKGLRAGNTEETNTSVYHFNHGESQ